MPTSLCIAQSSCCQAGTVSRRPLRWCLPLQNVPEGSVWKNGAQKSACGAQHHWHDGSSLQWPAQKWGQEPQRRMNDYREHNLQLLQADVSELLLMSWLSWSLKPLKAAFQETQLPLWPQRRREVLKMLRGSAASEWIRESFASPTNPFSSDPWLLSGLSGCFVLKLYSDLAERSLCAAVNTEQKLVWSGLEMCTQILFCSPAHGSGLAGALLGAVPASTGFSTWLNEE